MTDLILARRAVACSWWRWMPGMLATDGCHSWRVVEHRDCGGGQWDGEVPATAFPDLSDPATLGCLLGLVREAWGDPLVTTLAHEGGDATDPPTWTVWRPLRYGSQTIGSGPTEAEALVLALESAPKKGTP